MPNPRPAIVSYRLLKTRAGQNYSVIPPAKSIWIIRCVEFRLKYNRASESRESRGFNERRAHDFFLPEPTCGFQLTKHESEGIPKAIGREERIASGFHCTNALYARNSTSGHGRLSSCRAWAITAGRSPSRKESPSAQTSSRGSQEKLTKSALNFSDSIGAQDSAPPSIRSDSTLAANFSLPAIAHAVRSDSSVRHHRRGHSCQTHAAIDFIQQKFARRLRVFSNLSPCLWECGWRWWSHGTSVIIARGTSHCRSHARLARCAAMPLRQHLVEYSAEFAWRFAWPVALPIVPVNCSRESLR